MLDAMMSAEVGDDVFGSDPSVNHLQEKISNLFGMESAVYCPSGTMTNQIAIRVLTQPQDEVICHKNSHIYLYEGGGMMSNSMVSPKLLEGKRGMLTASQIEESINPNDIHFPRTKMVGVENTMNKGGGALYDYEELVRISKVCQEKNLFFHLDGARLFNAIVASNRSPEDFGKLFNTISICFSKGLGAPVGSVLLGSKEHISEALRVRKVFGGGMRQSGFLAAACSYALDHQVDRLNDDHRRARELGTASAELSFVKAVVPVETNIVILELEDGFSEGWLLSVLAKNGIEAVGFGKGLVRFVTHLNFGDDELTMTIEKLKKIKS